MMPQKIIDTPIQRLAIVIAMRGEAQPIIKMLQMEQVDAETYGFHPVLKLNVYKVAHRGKELFLVQNGVDEELDVDRVSTQAATVTTVSIIEKLKPDTILTIGTAGGLKEEQKIGDVILSTKEFIYIDRRINFGAYKHYGQGHYPCLNASLACDFLDLKPGRVVSESSLDPSDADKLELKKIDADVIDMEAAAIAETAKRFGVRVIALKSITNFLDSKLHSDFAANYEIATKELARKTSSFVSFILGKKPSQLSINKSIFTAKIICFLVEKQLSMEIKSHKKLKKELNGILSSSATEQEKIHALLEKIYTQYDVDLEVALANALDALSSFNLAAQKNKQYYALSQETIPIYLQTLPCLEAFHDPNTITVEDQSDGNFRIINKKTGETILLKQELFTSGFNEGYPPTSERRNREKSLFKQLSKYVFDYIPTIYYSDSEIMRTVVTEDLHSYKSVHERFLGGVKYPSFAVDVTNYLAHSLFHTSLLCLDSSEHEKLIKEYSFHSPSVLSSHFLEKNHLKNPLFSMGFRTNALHLKNIFLSQRESLIHGDLHTQSILVSESNTKVMHSGVAMMGPMGFDVGSILASLTIEWASYAAQEKNSLYSRWILEQLELVIIQFRDKFCALWNAHQDKTSSSYLSSEELPMYQQQYMERVLREAVGFAGLAICRRTLNSANSSATRTAAEFLALKIGKRFVEKYNEEDFNLDKIIMLIQQDMEENTASAVVLKSANPQDKLFASIEAIKEYGQYLSSQGSPKGKVAILLAEALYKKAASFFRQEAGTANFTKFKEEFSALLKSKNHELSEYRTAWPTIIANVLIALTGVGLFLIAGKLLHSNMTEGRPLYFFQKPSTTSEEKLGEVEVALNKLPL